MDNVVDKTCDVRCDDLAADTLLARARAVLSAVSHVVDRKGGPQQRQRVDDFETADEDLIAAERALKLLLAGSRATEEVDRTDLVAELVEVQAVRLGIGEARVHRRSIATEQLHQSLRRLRSGLSVAALCRQIPAELGDIGFSRSLLSGLRGTSWSARSAFAHSDDSLAEALVKVGNAVPGRIGREEPETEAVRRRRPILVRDAQSKPRIHRDLITLADTRDYAAAPIVAHGSVVALLHADRHSQADLLDGFDRDLLGLFAEGVGLAFERARYQEQLDVLKHQLQRHISGIDELTYGAVEWADEPADEQEPSMLEPGSIPHVFMSDGPLGELTRREIEVLRHLAWGATNQDIATRLGVSTGTVKTHMKNLLRKLGATNRADAAAKFHRLTSEPQERRGAMPTPGCPVARG